MELYAATTDLQTTDGKTGSTPLAAVAMKGDPLCQILFNWPMEFAIRAFVYIT